MGQLDEKERHTLLSFASRVDRNDPGAINNLGVVYYRKGLFAEAISQFKDALKLDPKFDLAKSNLQFVFQEVDIEDSDVKNWEAQVEKNPADHMAQLSLAISYHTIGRLENAIAILKRLLATVPDLNLARICLGNIFKELGSYDKALKEYLSVYDEMSGEAVYLTNLGEIYYNLGRLSQAIARLTTAVELDEEYWKPHFLLSFALGDEGKLDEAIEEHKTASRLNPAFQTAEANLMLTGGKLTQTTTPGRDSPDLDSEDRSTSLAMGIAYRERGYVDEALVEFEKAIKETPDNEQAVLEVAKILLQRGDVARASTKLCRVLEIDPNNAYACAILGTQHHLRGNHTGAAACYLRAYQARPADVRIINNLSALLYQADLPEDAERMFRMGLSQVPADYETNINLITCLILKEEFTVAHEHVKQLENTLGAGSLLYERRALINYRMDCLAPALEDIKLALAINDRSSDAIYIRAMVLLRKGRYDEAIASLIDAAALSHRFTGVDLVISSDDDHLHTVPSRIELSPSDRLMELLQAVIHRQFEGVAETLSKDILASLEFETDDSSVSTPNSEEVEV